MGHEVIASIRNFSHRIPFSFSSLFFKLGKFSAVMDGDKKLPDEQAYQAQ